MHPILFELFGWAVPSYAVMMALGYVLALCVALGLAKQRRARAGGVLPAGDLESWQVWDLFIVMLISSVLGAKFGHVLFEAPGHVDEQGRTVHGLLELLRADPWHWARLGEGGYVWYGGLLGALGVALIYFRRRPRLNAWLYADAFAPAIMAGAVVGRLGCFLAGCCYGRPTDLPWGVRFPGMDGPVHPTQLYDAGCALALALWLAWRFPRRRFDGENIALLLCAYAVLRSLSEALRGDADRGGLGPLSTSQLISVPVFLVGAFIYARRRRRSPPSAGVSADLPVSPAEPTR